MKNRWLHDLLGMAVLAAILGVVVAMFWPNGITRHLAQGLAALGFVSLVLILIFLPDRRH